MRVIVTGGAGFIGSNLVHVLLSQGHDVLVVDDLSTGTQDNIDPRSDFRRVDILDDSLPEIFSSFGPEAVVHLAAQPSVTASIRDPERDRAVNFEGTRRVALAAKAAGAARMISASSAAVYGDPEALPLTEEAATRPQSPYGESKLAAETALSDTLWGECDYASFRFANVYGPRQDAAGEGGVVAIFCDRMRRKEPPVVFGDGEQTRDFIFVGDVVNAIVTALGTNGPLATDGDRRAAFNISTGSRTSVTQLLMALRVASGYFGPERHEPPRPGDIVHSALDPTKAERSFGWKANVDLESGTALTWRWFASR